jgi:hypothetical protein
VRPEAIRRRVDFPHPDGPTTVTNSPGETLSETSSRARVPSGNRIDTLVKASAAELADAPPAAVGEGVDAVLTMTPPNLEDAPLGVRDSFVKPLFLVLRSHRGGNDPAPVHHDP